MAVLKDLIVHGPSRFIGKTQFNTINGTSVGADVGIFKKLIATTLKAETASIEDLTAQNATVVGLMDVQGELHTNAWTNANIANIGGSFYISPSVESVSGTITINKNSSNWTVQITGSFATDFIKTANATTASAWPVDSLVLVTGNIVVNNMEYPLGTLKGKLTAQVAASAASSSKTISMSCASTYTDNPNADVLQMLYEANDNANITNAPFSNGKISMYKISGTKPIGILLSSVGITSQGSNYIDIYGGTNNDGSPNLRIGHLTGLPAINLNGKSMTPTGWGLYADNAYLSGTIHSAAGIIGGFTIDSNSLHNGTFGTANSVLVSTGTSSAANIAGSGSISGWAFTAGTTYGVTKAGALYATSGNIAGWTFNSTSLYKNNATPGASSSTMVISTGTASTNNIGGGGTASKTWMLSAGTGFGVTTSGILYATGAVISGTLTAGANSTIGPWTVSASAIYNTKTSLTDANEGVWLGSDGIALGKSSVFKVTKAGALTATSATITGTINALTGTFGNATNKITVGTGTSGHSAIRYGMTTLADTTNTGFYIGTDGVALGKGAFKVTAAGALTATSATITGAITATSLSLGTNVSIAAGKVTGLSTVATSGKYSDLSGTPNLTIYIAKDGTIGSTPASGANGFKVSSAGVLTASNAIIYGTIYATTGTIGGCSISSGVLKVKEANIDGKLTASVLNVSTLSAITGNMGTLTSGTITYGTVGSNSSFYLSSTDKTATIAGASRTGLRLTVGSNFGVTNTGAFYASAGAIGDSVTIGGTAASTVLSNIGTAGTKATTYITDIDSNLGITLKPATKTGNDYLQMNSTDIRFVRNNVDVMNLTDSAFRIGMASSGHSTVKSDGLHVWTGVETTASNEVAFFGATTRVGKIAANTSNIRIMPKSGNDQAGLYFYVNTTKVGSLTQSTAYTPTDSATTYNNALVLDAAEYLAVRMGSAKFPIIETATDAGGSGDHEVYINFGKGSDYASLMCFDNVDDSGSETTVELWGHLGDDDGEIRSTMFNVYGGIDTEDYTTGVGLGVAGYSGYNDEVGVWTYAKDRWLIGAKNEGAVFSPGVYLNTTSSGSNVRVYNSQYGYLKRYASSSRRYKKDIEPISAIELDPHHLYNIEVVQFKYKEDYLDKDDRRYNKLVPGFIAEQIEEAYQIATNYEDNMVEDWEERMIIPPMLKLIQEQHKEIEQLKKEVQNLKNK